MKKETAVIILIVVISALTMGLYLKSKPNKTTLTKQKKTTKQTKNRKPTKEKPKPKKSQKTHNEQKAKAESRQKSKASSTITLAAVGDVLIHDTVYLDARTENGYNFKPMFAPVKENIKQADIAFANQESLTADTELGLSGYPTFNGPKEIAETIKWAGFDIVNMANNHTLDRGAVGVKKSINYWKKLGIEYIGANLSDKDDDRARILNKNDIKVGFLGYTYGTNGIPTPAGKKYLVNRIDTDQIIKDVKKIEKQTNLIVVSLHFGTQYQQNPNNRQKKIAKKLSQAGVDIILGHHPHVLQPVKWIKSEDGNKTLVAYSLGNFLSGQYGTERKIGGIIKIKVNKDKNKNKTKIKQVDLIPTYTSEENKKKFKVVPLEEADKSQLDNKEYWQNEVKKLIQKD